VIFARTGRPSDALAVDLAREALSSGRQALTSLLYGRWRHPWPMDLASDVAGIAGLDDALA
jgi:hypothetical protein